MNNSFFKIVEPTFFNVFSGKNREINYEILQLINDRMKDDFDSYEKSEILSWIREYIDNHPSLKKVDDENEEIEFQDNKDWSMAKINYFVKAGWLSSETVGFKQVFTMNSAGVAILSAMSNIVRNETKPIEYTGYVYNIYNNLKHFEINKATAYIEMLESIANEFNNSLRSVNLSIKKYLNSLLKNHDNSAKSILKTLLEDYHDNVVAKVFTNLRTGDNPSKYKGEIISIIDDLLDNRINELVENYLKTKKSKDRHEAENYIRGALNSIRDTFTNVNDNINTLNVKNEKYVQSANARIQFLLNNDKNVEGIIYNILQQFESKNIDEDEAFPTGLKELGRIDENSLYKYTRRKFSGPVKSDFVMPVVDEKYKQQEIERMQRNIKFNVKNVDKWILGKLGDKECIEAKQIEIKEYDELIILFLAMAYAINGISHYKVDYKDACGFVVFKNSRLENFIIRRK